MTRVSRIPLVAAAAIGAVALVATGPGAAARAGGPAPGGSAPGAVAPKSPSATGTGGAVASVDADATAIGIEVLRRGGNAADAAIATAAALGVTEPYSAGIGGGGFFVYYDARSRRVSTIDGRETAPRSFTPSVFTGADGAPLDFATTVSSGLSVGVPGTPALWDRALHRFGRWSFGDVLAPAEQLARRGFTVDATFNQQTTDNAARFARFPATAQLYLPGGRPLPVGSVQRNPDLADTYRQLRRQGVGAFYRGAIGDALVATARNPRTTDGVPVYPGQITATDLAVYRAIDRDPTKTGYRGLAVYGMPVPSSGGIAVGEALNLLESYDRLTGKRLSSVEQLQYLHRLSEASATAFADRNRWVGDVPGVPAAQLLSQRFADERACGLFDPAKAHPRPIPFGSPDGRYDGCAAGSLAQAGLPPEHGTTHLVAADRWGNVATYTLTIEQTGGSGITVPGYGFLLNNELTDFNFVPLQSGVPDPNLPGPGKRPRSSMSPTLVLDHGRPLLAVGSPGGATIITTVLQVVTGTLDRGLPLVDAIAAPRLSSRNGAEQAEPALFGGPLGDGLRGLGHTLTSTPEIGAASGIRLLPGGRFTAAAETSRRGGGAAAVVRPSR
jgi:gamma-glutamyltranspeptidase/glutathione hydrolase